MHNIKVIQAAAELGSWPRKCHCGRTYRVVAGSTQTQCDRCALAESMRRPGPVQYAVAVAMLAVVVLSLGYLVIAAVSAAAALWR